MRRGEQRLRRRIVIKILPEVDDQQTIVTLLAKEPKDERDNLIEAKSYRAGYLFLVLGVIVCMNLPSHPVATGPFLLVLLVGEVSKAITQLVYYRRGV